MSNIGLYTRNEILTVAKYMKNKTADEEEYRNYFQNYAINITVYPIV